MWDKTANLLGWETTQSNLALAPTPDPALLDEAEAHVRAARAVFVDGSDYQTGRCNDLLAQVSAARGEA